MDEAQRLKAHDTIQTKSVFHKTFGVANQAYWKWALSGTIMPNRPVELYPILKTMAPKTLSSYRSWTAYINRYCGGAYLAGRGASNIQELTANLQPFMLRRDLKDVWQDMPPLIENDVWLDVNYQNHPEWLGEGFMYESTERRLIAESKIPAIYEYILDRLSSGVDKICVFTYHREVSEQLAKKLNCAAIYGGMTVSKREKSFESFLTDLNCHVIIIQIGSGGEGLDRLQEVCSEVIEAEPEWSPGREDQAIARIMRLGQTKPVILTRLLAAESYEETIYKSNNKKRRVIEIITKPNGGSFVMAKAKTTNSEFSIEENIEIMRITLESILKVLEGSAAQLPVAPGRSLPERVAENFAKARPEFIPPNGHTEALLPGASPAAPANPLGIGTTPSPLINIPMVGAVAAAPSALLVTPTASVPVANANRAAFEKQVVDKVKAMGDFGFPKMEAALAQFGVERLSQIPEESFFRFMEAI